MRPFSDIQLIARRGRGTRLRWCIAAALLFGLSIPVSAQLVPNLGGQRSGISAFQFLKIAPDARGTGMGESFVAVANDVSALYWNPAGLTNALQDQAVFSHTEWLVDLKHEFAGASFHLSPNDIVGAAFTSLHTDPMKVTTETQPTGTGSYFTYGDIAIGATYARKMTDQFSFGITARYVRETIDMLKAEAVLIDLGTYYTLGIGNARFAVVVSNFGSNVGPKGTAPGGDGMPVTAFQQYSPPTMFKLGVAFEPYETEDHRVTTSIQLNHPNDNAENVRLGVEYAFESMFFLRAGVKRTIGESMLGKSTSSAEDFTFGGGVRVPIAVMTVNADYSFANFNDLGSVHRFTVAISY
ncbi:MAG TPA: PorV/PorQ family protein [Bacteroidota bacterium]|nr:PorV/PorQ family protein [Bacteroidota bacterium]